MPRARKPGALAPKSRSRNGCWPCKGRKVKCGEEHPSCLNCLKLGDACDYNIRLNWGGRRTKKSSQSLASPSAPAPPQQQQQQQHHANPEPSLILKRSYTFPTTASSPSTAVCSPIFQQNSQVPPAWQVMGQGSPESLEYKDGTSHVPRASSSSSLFGKGASSFPVSVAVMPSWSPLGRQAETFFSPLVDDAGSCTPQARHRRAKSLAEVSDAMSACHHSPIMSSSSSHNTGSPCPPLYMARHGYSSVSHGSPATTAVSAVLSDEEESKTGLLLPPPMPPFQQSGADATEAYSFYGFDVGAQDRDIGRNDDAVCAPYIGLPAFKSEGGVHLSSTSLGDRGAMHEGLDGYYDAPVPILVPRHLEPLPEKLKGNRMNLLYFHHFINHTARVFVPYDDLLSNPFHTVLPQIAVKDDTLLSLLLAYSASHRARVLQQNEPEMRMATWVEDIFPALRRTLNDDEGPVSDAKMATAIMLTSLEIISPAAFGFDIPWQRHLATARSLMAKRIQLLAGYGCSPADAAVASFLWSWLAYLNVMGSLSGGAAGEAYACGDEESQLPMLPGLDQDLDEIDCIMGFSLRCLGLLFQVAGLIRRYEGQQPLDITLNVDQDAVRLDQDLRTSMLRPAHPCRHVRPRALDSDDIDEMAALNEAFHLAGLIHLHRRVLGKTASHPDVAVLVGRVLLCLGWVQHGGSFEAAMLFPMFTAGCDVPDDTRRGQVLERFRSIEVSGMTQVRRARRLMEKAWVLGRPWETVMTTEFIG